MKKKFICCVCVFTLVATIFPAAAFAANYGSWYCPKCNTKNALEYEGDNYDTCSGCGRIYEQCPDCCNWIWWRNVNWENGICPNCGYEQWPHDVRANLRNQVYAYGQCNRIIVDVTYDVNVINIYRVNPNGSVIEVACFNPQNASYYWETENRNYDYSIEYWDYGLKQNAKYKYFVDYSLIIYGSGADVDCGRTSTKTYWTAPKAKASNVTTNGTKVSWTKVNGASGYCVTLKNHKKTEYKNVWDIVTRKQWTTKTFVYRKTDPSPFYKYERVNSVRSYTKHGDKYYAHGQKVRTVKTNLFK